MSATNPYTWPSPLWRAWQQGHDAQDEKWRKAIANLPKEERK